MAVELRIASQNQGKLAEFRALLEPLGFSVQGPPRDFDVDEDGETFESNAAKKAEALCALTGTAALADDSGLEVDALGGAPGVRSARYAELNETAPLGKGDRDRANRHRLLRELAGVPQPQRTARFVCVLAYALPGKPTQLFRGTVEGHIGIEERGEGGFGYDRLVLMPGGRTMAELSDAEKNATSHRGRAVQLFLAALRR